jgi:hypothetical protein
MMQKCEQKQLEALKIQRQHPQVALSIPACRVEDK